LDRESCCVGEIQESVVLGAYVSCITRIEALMILSVVPANSRVIQLSVTIYDNGVWKYSY